MKIVITHTDFRLYWIPRIINLNRKLKTIGHKLIIIEIANRGSPYKFAKHNSKDIKDISWITLFKHKKVESLTPRQMSKALFNKLEELQPDLVIAGAIAFPSGATAVRWCRKRKRPVIIMDNARFKDVPRSKLINYIKKRIYKNVDGVLIPAYSHLNDYLRWGISKNRIFFGLNVIDNNWFLQKVKVLKKKKKEIYFKFRLPSNFFLGVGRQVYKKNWDTLILAFKEYKKKRKKLAYDLILIGDGPENKKLKKLVKKYKIDGIHFISFLDQEKLCVYYAYAKALILPSYYGETWGNVVNEAMACGLPVIVSKECGCASTLILEGKNGWTFSPYDKKELTKKMIQLSKLKQKELKEMGQISKEIISRWSLDRFSEEVCNAINKCKHLYRGYSSIVDRIILNAWNGKYNPT